MKRPTTFKALICIIVALLLAAKPAHLHAQQFADGPITVDDAVAIGLRQSRPLEIARLDRDLARQKIRETWSQVLPQLTSGLTYTRTLEPSVLLLPPNPFAPNGVLEVSSDNALHATLDLRQTLFDGSAFAGIKAAGNVRRMSDEAYRATGATIVSNIRIAYFDVLIAEEQLKLIEQSIERWKTARKDTKAMFRQGLVADIDTLRAHLSVENLRPDLLRATNRVVSSRTSLKNAMGVANDLRLNLVTKLEPRSIAVPQTLREACDEALLKRPELNQLTWQLKAEGNKVSAAWAQHLPVLSAFGRLESQTAFNDGIDANWTSSSSVGLQLTLPIFSGFRTSALIEQARLGELQTRSRLDDLRTNIYAEVETRLADYNESQQRLDIQSKTIALAERGYRITTLRYREGLGSRLELSDAELQLDKAKTNYLQAVYDNLVAGTLLEKALGRTGGVTP